MLFLLYLIFLSSANKYINDLNIFTSYFENEDRKVQISQNMETIICKLDLIVYSVVNN